MSADLLPHHAAWLTAHPHRSEAWLRSMLAEEFDVHHVDGDHGNDNPANLVLIEHTDHLQKLHMMRPGSLGRLTPRSQREAPVVVVEQEPLTVPEVPSLEWLAEGVNFLAIIDELGLTQAGFANCIGIHRQTVSAWVRNGVKVPRYATAPLQLVIIFHRAVQRFKAPAGGEG